MNESIIIVVGIAIIYQGYKLIQRQRGLRKQMDRLKRQADDFNVEFGSEHGIELVKKNYPDLELRDDHRTGLEEVSSNVN